MNISKWGKKITETRRYFTRVSNFHIKKKNVTRKSTARKKIETLSRPRLSSQEKSFVNEYGNDMKGWKKELIITNLLYIFSLEISALTRNI